jgi:hypothetical protein
MTNDVDYDQDGKISSSCSSHLSKQAVWWLKMQYRVCQKYKHVTLLKTLAKCLLWKLFLQ